MSNELTTTTTALVVTPPAVPIDISVTAENADEMAQCQGALIDWCEAKVASVRAEATELWGACEHAKKMKWRTDTLKRAHERAVKRQDFYERMLTALNHGYQIVPSFPVTAFAIRTDRKKPLKMITTRQWDSHEQQTQVGLPAGEGEYRNPFPVVFQKPLTPKTPTENEKREYWAKQWNDLEFPISMSKPRIMEAATRAMALKIFDDLGILPGAAPKGDPLIVARLRYPKPSVYGNKSDMRFVSFIICWHLDTATL